MRHRTGAAMMDSQPGSTMRRREAVAGYLFVLPVLLGFLVWVLFPLVGTVVVSFTDWPLDQPPKWVHLQNYRSLVATGPLFDSVRATLYFAAASTASRVIVAFFVAMLLNQEVKGRALFRTIYYLPSIVPIVASSMIFLWCFQPDFGLFNAVLRSLGLPPLRWIFGPDTVIPSFVIMDVWAAGPTIVIFLAGLQGVPRELLDAVAVDGGKWRHRMIAVTLPHMSPYILFNSVVGLITALQTFTQGYVMTRGGPNNRSLFMVILIWREAFSYGEFGTAAAVAVMLFGIIALLTVLVFVTSSRFVFYYGAQR